MPLEIEGQVYYRTADVCLEAGISRSTLLRWLKEGILDKSFRDRNGWRVFTGDDLNRIKLEANRIQLGERP